MESTSDNPLLSKAIKLPNEPEVKGNAAIVNERSKLLHLAQKFNSFYLSGLKSGKCLPFLVENIQVGLIRPDVRNHLALYPDVFHFNSYGVTLDPNLRDNKERTAKLLSVLKDLKSKNALCTLNGWRDESFDVKSNFSAEPLLKMDRSATCIFGICNYGVDITGYVMDPKKGLCIWLQQRALAKPTWPGKWDNMVGGGLSCGYGILETAFKEAEEEASIPKELMVNLKAAGSVSFYFESERGLFPNTEFVFDLELPSNFIPKNNDGEVKTFELLTAKEALERSLSPDFKTTSCPVLLDFLFRHGYITPDSEPHYAEIIELLHVPLQTLYGNFSKNCYKENGDNIT